MLDETDQVRRFLFDLKEAYDIDRMEWIYAKEDFKNQIDMKENLLIDCNMKINELLSVVIINLKYWLCVVQIVSLFRTINDF